MAARRKGLIDIEVMAQAAECLKTLAHPCRLRMIEMLLNDDYTVGELADACDIPSHMASEHLGRMRDRGLLSCERKGREVYYSVKRDGLKHIIECVRRHF